MEKLVTVGSKETHKTNKYFMTNIHNKSRKRVKTPLNCKVSTLLLVASPKSLVDKRLYLNLLNYPEFKTTKKTQDIKNLRERLKKISTKEITTSNGLKVRVFQSILYSKGVIYTTLNPTLETLKEVRGQFTKLDLTLFSKIRSKHSANILVRKFNFFSKKQCIFSFAQLGYKKPSNLKKYVLEPVIKDLAKVGLIIDYSISTRKKTVIITFSYMPKIAIVGSSDEEQVLNTPVAKLLVNQFGFPISFANDVVKKELISTSLLQTIRAHSLDSKNPIFGAIRNPQAYIIKVVCLNAFQNRLQSELK